MNFFDHKVLGNHLLQLCPKVVKHPVYLFPGTTTTTTTAAAITTTTRTTTRVTTTTATATTTTTTTIILHVIFPL
jgi:hypothetical protein